MKHFQLFSIVGRLALASCLALAAAAAPLSAQTVVFDQACFPTCDVTDGKFLVIASGVALQTLGEEPLNLKFAVNAGESSFRIEIFDGDSNRVDAEGASHWDFGLQIPLRMTLKADPTGDPADQVPVDATKITLGGNPGSNPFSSQLMFDNDWFAIDVETGPEAADPSAVGSGNFFYVLTIEVESSAPPGQSVVNGLKVRTNESVFLSLLEQPFAFEAIWSNIADLPIVFPNFNENDLFNPKNARGSNYDGVFSFFLEVPAAEDPDGIGSLRVFDGDLDRGKFDGTEQDTDDPDTCNTQKPFFAVADTAFEGVAAGIGGTTGAPPDDANRAGLGIYLGVPPSVEYRVVFPMGTSPQVVQCNSNAEGEVLADGRAAVVNKNPSGNREWEHFVLSTDPFMSNTDCSDDIETPPLDPPTFMDCEMDSLPSGIYELQLSGMDIQNLNFWFFEQTIVCLYPDGSVCMPRPQRFLIGDTVWEDFDGDGVRQADEPGFRGVRVNLVDRDGRVLDSRVTDADGLYEFSVGTGTFTVEVAPENFVGPIPRGAVGDFVWLDLDGDGNQDGGEPGIANVRVSLFDAGADGVPSAGDLQIAAQRTDADGRYWFRDLDPGTYYTRVDVGTLPIGLTLTGGSDPSAVRTIVSDDIFDDLDFGYGNADPATAIVGNYVWHDVDVDGLQDGGEPGLGRVSLSLVDANTNLVVAKTVTRADGSYYFTEVAPGTYVVDVTDAFGVLAGYTLTVGADSNPDPTAPFAVAAGDVVVTKDFGYQNPGLYSISDVVWFDRDRDAVLDGSESGLGGVTVVLYGPGGRILATTTTDADGNFSFSGLPDGAYSLLISDLGGVLNGLLPTTLGAARGSHPVSIAGADVAGINFGYVDEGVLEGAVATTPSPTQTDTVVDANILTYDFGYNFPCGACDGKVTRLEMRYNGPPALVEVRQKKPDVAVLPPTLLGTGDEFEIFGQDKKGTLSTEVFFFVDGVFHSQIHTSCSQPIFPGLVRGDFEVVSGDSRNGGRLCPAGCGPCKGGVTELNLRNTGAGAFFTIYDSKDPKPNKIVFEGFLASGAETGPFSGRRSDGKFESEISIWSGGVRLEKVHTSCSQPIGVGFVFGGLEVVSGKSKDNGKFCSAGCAPDSVDFGVKDDEIK